MTTDKNVTRVALIGFGLSGRVFHAPLLSASDAYDLTHIMTSRRDEALACYPGVTVCGAIGEILENPQIDMLVISTPNHLHFEHARMALLADKHVVIEKPMAVTHAQALELCALANTRQRKLTVFHNRRWDGDFLTVQQLIRDERLGQVHRIEVQFDRYRPQVKARWKEQHREGGGTLYDLGAHLLDQAVALLGMPDSLYARVRTLRPGAAAADDFVIHLHYPATQVILRSSSLAAATGPRWLVMGERGAFVKSGMDPQEGQLAGGVVPHAPEFGCEPQAQWGQFTDAEGNTREVETQPGQYLGFYQSLARAIQDDLPVPVSGESAAQVIRLIEASEVSSRENRVIAL